LSAPPDEKLFPKAYETDWVKPGRAVWRYLDLEGGRGPADPLPAASAKPQAAAPTSAPATTQSRSRVTIEEMKEFNRLAGELGFEYNVLEGFWRRWSDDELRDLVADARKHNVGLFVWVHSRNLYDPQARAELFKRLRDTGIIGLKIDFFDHEHKEVIDLYFTLLREAAENKMLLNFHGANKPTGESRTWPNELVREAVRGMEASRMNSRAAHDATIPFTRYTVGHGEYTPVHFGDRRGDTTWAHQIATPVVFTAPLLTYGAHPRKMLDSPAVEMLKSIPATWDETIVLPSSEIGEVAVMARRKGDVWFLAVVSGPEPRKLNVPLTFLGDGDYRALIVKDRTGASAAIDIENTPGIRRDATMTIDCSAGGGFVARFTK
jgi:alpha-glucosidase